MTPAPEPQRCRLFLSYHRKSAPAAERIVADLEGLGHHVWYDRELTGGQVWWTHILSQVRACDAFVMALEAGALRSVACQRELAYAAALGKPLLPIVVEEISPNLLPPILATVQLVDGRIRDHASALEFARAVASLPAAPLLPDPLPTLPDAPLSHLGDLAQRIEAPALSPEEQAAVAAALGPLARDKETALDALELLRRLRHRVDLLPTVASEINALLSSGEALLRESQLARATGSARPIGFWFITTQWQAGACFAIVGAIFGGVTAVVNWRYFTHERPEVGLVAGGGATLAGLAGLIAGPDRRSIIWTFLGFVVGICAAGFGASDSRFLVRAAFEAPLYAVIAAVLAAVTREISGALRRRRSR